MKASPMGEKVGPLFGTTKSFSPLESAVGLLDLKLPKLDTPKTIARE